ncbi:MAG: NYN domain-containing protein [Oscillospiraceae bacterium]|nr:NYN domain-containing protein [Oscillospiraceae bacterium]
MTDSDTYPRPQPYTDYENSTYVVISKIAYLIGIPKRIFENVHEPPQLEWYEHLDQEKPYRIVRNLCVLRAAILQNYKAIYTAMRYDLKNLHTLPDLVPYECIAQLERDGMTILKSNYPLLKYILDFNRYISDRINNCKHLFPLWLKWEYIRSLFLMPDGSNERGVKAALNDYNYRRSSYPYQIYLNWPYSHNGNILYNDKKFVSLLYEANEDYFYDLSKVSDAGNRTKDGIYQFLAHSTRTAVVVDCENADPYKLYATLNNLDQEALLDKIVKIILYNDIHAATTWKILDKFTDIPIEHNMVDRVKENKSLVDIRLTTGTCREFFQNAIDSFILVSSDSDYWGLISSIQEAHFLVLVESEKCGPDMKQAMLNAGITYCYMDDFCTGNSEEIKIQTLLGEIRHTLADAVQFNINTVLDNAYTAARADMTTAERQQFYDKYIKPMRLVVDTEGNVQVALGPL